jgi:hypothetical protein
VASIAAEPRPAGSVLRREFRNRPYIGCVRTRNPRNRKLAVESAAFGLGYAAVLIWIGAALVASFTDYEATPYWPNIPHLRTDTSGDAAFAIAIVTLSLSRYLQLRRRGRGPAPSSSERPARILAIQAIAETAVVLATGMVIYLSFNAFTHPETLRLQLTHLWPWPSEGTVRVIGLGICAVGAATSRYLRAGAPLAGQAAPAPEAVSVPEKV